MLDMRIRPGVLFLANLVILLADLALFESIGWTDDARTGVHILTVMLVVLGAVEYIRWRAENRR